MNKEQIKKKIIEIYNRKEYPLFNIGNDNDGKHVKYKNIEMVSFIKYFTRLLAYGSKDADDYIVDGHNEIVFLTESMLNDEVKNIEECKTINEAIDELLNPQSDWTVCWTQKPLLSYVVEQIYNKKELDNKKWGW